jgi:hypothetical protein
MARTCAAAARSALAVGLCACALGAALVSGNAPNGPFVTSINGLGVPVSEWPTSSESVSSMTLNLLTDVDPLVRCTRTRTCVARVAHAHAHVAHTHVCVARWWRCRVERRHAGNAEC